MFQDFLMVVVFLPTVRGNRRKLQKGPEKLQFSTQNGSLSTILEVTYFLQIFTFTFGFTWDARMAVTVFAGIRLRDKEKLMHA
jgi:hypothetical protein